jgi:hypothetical protein
MFIHKSGRFTVTCVLYFYQIHQKQFPVSLLFESRIGDFPQTLLLVSWAKIQYIRDGEGPDLWINVDQHR